MSKLPVCRFHALILAFSIFLSFNSLAQTNDDCTNATVIPTALDSICLSNQTNRNATASNVPRTKCLSSLNNEVWYTFVATKNVAFIELEGPTGSPLLNPSIALYTGTCAALEEIACASGENIFSTSARLRVENTVPNTKYFIRVSSAVSGNFRLCLRQVQTDPFWDCPTAKSVCSNQPISIPEMFYGGKIINEMSDATCFGTLNSGLERSSAWLTFTAANSGNLTFTITPNNPRLDIDFVLYKLPNGKGDCTGKIVERCMAAGDLSFPSPCMGPTGLNETSTFTQAPPNCEVSGHKNFLKALTLEQGATYALAVLNIDDGEANAFRRGGFRLQWGGTARFLSNDVIFPNDTVVAVGGTATLVVRPAISGQPLPTVTWTDGTATTTGSSLVVPMPQAGVRRYLVKAGECAVDTVVVRAVTPLWDCDKKLRLSCKRDTIIEYVVGNGNDPTELNDASCLPRRGNNAEAYSSWFTFVADDNGSLDFTLTPLNAADNLDFVVYRLPNGPNNCANRVVERCMGANNVAQGCSGPTGLRANATATALSATQCQDNNFLRSLTLQAGTAYALSVVNNGPTAANTRFEQRGFRLQWGGTAQFRWIQFPRDTTIPEGQSVTLSTIPLTGLATPPTVTWFELDKLGNRTERHKGLSHVVTLAGDSVVYIVSATNGLCSVEKKVTVRSQKYLFELPNIFTPNGDEFNNVLKPVLKSGDLVRIEVWSRWGNLIYDSDIDQPSNGWNGTVKSGEEAPQDVYFYRATVRKRDGTIEIKVSEVTLVR